MTEREKQELVQSAVDEFARRVPQYANLPKAEAVVTAFLDGVQWTATRLIVEDVTR